MEAALPTIETDAVTPGASLARLRGAAARAPPLTRAELETWFRGGEPEADACEQSPRLGGAGSGAVWISRSAKGSTRSGSGIGSRSWAITSTTTPARSWTSGSALPRTSPGSGRGCARVPAPGGAARRARPDPCGGDGAVGRGRRGRGALGRARRRADGPGAGGGGPRGAGAAGGRPGRGGVGPAAHASAAGRAAGRRRGARGRPRAAAGLDPDRAAGGARAGVPGRVLDRRRLRRGAPARARVSRVRPRSLCAARHARGRDRIDGRSSPRFRSSPRRTFRSTRPRRRRRSTSVSARSPAFGRGGIASSDSAGTR